MLVRESSYDTLPAVLSKEASPAESVFELASSTSRAARSSITLQNRLQYDTKAFAKKRPLRARSVFIGPTAAANSGISARKIVDEKV